MPNYGVGPRVGGGTKRKGPSKTIRIVDPTTMEEVTGSGGGESGSGTTATALVADFQKSLQQKDSELESLRAKVTALNN